MTYSTTQTREDHFCIVCQKRKKIGLYIHTHFICKNCEGEMVTTEVYDEKYPFFVKQMKKIWVEENV